MPSIQEQSPGQAHPLLNSITQDERVRSLLLSSHMADKPRQDELVAVLHDKIRDLEPSHRYALYCDSLSYLSNENCTGGQDGRDALAIVFPQVAVETSAHEYNNQETAADRLTAPFLKALDQISAEKSDVYGSFDAIMQAGAIVATEARIVQNVGQRNHFVAVVKEKAGSFLQSTSDEAAIEYGFKLFETFQSTVIFGGNQLGFQGQDEQEKTRARPKMSAAETLLHDRYLETVSQRGRLKQTLWEAVPGFRKTCSENGIDLARFWNKQNPDDMAQAINELRVNNPQAYEQLQTEAAGTGLAETLVSEETVKVHADELYRTAHTTYENVSRQVAVMAKDLDRIAAVMERGSWQNPKAKAKFYTQLAGLAKTYGVLGADEDTEIDLEHIRQALDAKAQLLIQIQQAIGTAFDNFQNANSRFSISGRTKADMYFSDETGDCTAYHLDCGMNGHTVPIWLSMPNFVFSLIHDDQGNMLAKLGLLLGWRDNQPCLVIDSIESSRLIPPRQELEASMYIEEGLSDIIAWGREIGLPVTYGYSFNNSSELIQQIEARSVNASAGDFELFGGLDGLHEYMESFGCTDTDYRLHLQTYEHAFDDDFTVEANAAELQAFESAINSLISNASRENRPELAAALQSGDHRQFIRTYLRLYCGEMLSFMDITTDELYELAHARGVLDIRSEISMDKVTNSALLAAFNVSELALDEATNAEDEFEGGGDGDTWFDEENDEDSYEDAVIEAPHDLRTGVIASIDSALDLIETEALLEALQPEEAFRRIFGSVDAPAVEMTPEDSSHRQLKLRPSLPQIIEK